MTWYASEVFAVPGPAATAILGSEAPLKDHLYFLPPESWSDQKVLQITQAGRPYAELLPSLLVVSEVHGRGTGCAEWNSGTNSSRRPPAYWDEITGPGDEDVRSSAVLSGICSPDELPPDEFLRFLKRLSNRTQTPVAYFFRSTWGNTEVESEFAWLFSAEDHVYARKWGANGGLFDFSVGNALRLDDDDLLVLVLRHFGITVKPWRFPPHRRDFRWELYRLGKQAESGQVKQP